MLTCEYENIKVCHGCDRVGLHKTIRSIGEYYPFMCCVQCTECVRLRADGLGERVGLTREIVGISPALGINHGKGALTPADVQYIPAWTRIHYLD